MLTGASLLRLALTVAIQLAQHGRCQMLADQQQVIFNDARSLLAATGSHMTPSTPNVIVILTDDQDLQMDSLDYMPSVRKHLVEQGTTFNRHYCTTAICCPSRVTMWTGRLAHNTNVTDVRPPYGGFPKFVAQGYNSNWLPVWLEQAGYNNYYVGKLFNGHSVGYYDDPFPAGFKHTYFLLDPHTYDYTNATFQHDREPPRSYPGRYSTDLVRDFGYELLDDAARDAKPFFLTLAPIAPHSHVDPLSGGSGGDGGGTRFQPPVPAPRHAGLFGDARVPRTASFNPEAASGGGWVRALPRQNATVVGVNDDFYRQRLRALQAVDEMVDGLFARLAARGLLDRTFVFYTSDNGFHIGQHRLQPGKTCGYEEDVRVPLVVRGPGVARARRTELVTTHADLAPTWLRLLGVPLPSVGGFGFDGAAFPVSEEGVREAEESRSARTEHVNVEYWGHPYIESPLYGRDANTAANTYKSVRIVAADYNLYYSVWCNNEHELYDMTADPYQMDNLLPLGNGTLWAGTATAKAPILGYAAAKVALRLDALLLVLKTCKQDRCIRPWAALHPDGSVRSLRDALDRRYDAFYEAQARVSFSDCALGQIPAAEGPRWEDVGNVFERDGLPWDAWT